MKGGLFGIVTDAKNQTPLVGVTVQVKNTFNATYTDLHGHFEFKNIQAGDCELMLSYIGYGSKIVKAKVNGKQTDTTRVALEESVFGLGEITIQATRPVSAASSMEFRAIDMQLKPLKSSEDLLTMVPGLFISQHQGGGKAEQIFLRGFDCDHGTDVAVSVDGMPVNMVSHAHGQGYADLHFLIPETVDEMEVNKGPYLAGIGDFYTAGSVNMKTKDILDNSIVKIEGGQFNTRKYTMLFQPDQDTKTHNGYMAAQYHHSDGPFDSPEGYVRMNIAGKYYFQLSEKSRVTVSANGFTTRWNASGQIPIRAVNSGLIGRFGALDNLEGGVTDRENLLINYRYQSSEGNEFEVNSYFTKYNFKLFSNFSYYLNDTTNGDMIEQVENRTLQGVNLAYKFTTSWFGLRQINKVGSGYRGDLVDVQLYQSPERFRLKSLTNDVIDEQNLNAWFQQELVMSKNFRVIWGLRHDFFTFSKDDRLGNTLDTTGNGLPRASGIQSKSILNPKLNLIYSTGSNIDLFLNFGQGFHSNDARDMIISSTIYGLSSKWKKEGLTDAQVDARLLKYNLDPGMRNAGTLPKATAGEFGMKGRLFGKLYLVTSAWYMYLQKEYVYIGDGGVTELSNPTQRLGLDFEARLEIKPWLWVDADLTAAKGTIKNLPAGENNIPLAPRLTATGGISVVRDEGFSGALRFRHLGSRPANEDNSVVALGYTLVGLSIDYKYKNLTFTVNGDNLLNTKWNEAQFANETRLKGEPAGVTELSFTPGNPINFQFGVSYKF
ncbi:MAG: TonB-dependent receptor [Bacteroidales bacterium]